MTAAITAETTAGELAAELRALADRVERATSWTSLRESLDALTPALRPLRGRVVRHTRVPKTAPAARPTPAPKVEPAKVAAPAPVKAEPKAAPKEPATAATAPPKAAPEPAPVASPAPARTRCPGTVPLLIAALAVSLWMTAGAVCHDASWRVRRHCRNAIRPIRFALGDAADWVAWVGDRAAAGVSTAVARVVSALRRRS